MRGYVWRSAFGPRPSFLNLPAFLLWALIGNAEDGPYGFLAPADHPPGDWRTAWRWWSRNPFHNLTWHVVAVPILWSVVLIGTPERRPAVWPAGRGVIVALHTLPLVTFRLAGWEGYVGWRPHVRRDTGRPFGAFGIALRKQK